MPSTRYTRIEITPDAYKALEAEAILQGKTLKKLSSELILQGVSKKALEFVQGARESGEANPEFNGEKMTKVISKIGAVGMHINKNLLDTLQEILLEEGYSGAMLHVAQHTASAERDELHRVLTICERYKLSPSLAAEVIKNLNNLGTKTS